MSNNPYLDGRKEARFPRGYGNPYKSETSRAEWQRGYEDEELLLAEEAKAEREHANRSLYQVIGDGDFAEALRRIAEHVGMDIYA